MQLRLKHLKKAGVVLSLALLSGLAQAKESEAEHIKELTAQHKAMAEAHATAAKCLESGKGEKACHEALQKTCKGLAIGKYCGMKHQH